MATSPEERLAALERVVGNLVERIERIERARRERAPARTLDLEELLGGTVAAAVVLAGGLLALRRRA